MKSKITLFPGLGTQLKEGNMIKFGHANLTFRGQEREKYLAEKTEGGVSREMRGKAVLKRGS